MNIAEHIRKTAADRIAAWDAPADRKRELLAVVNRAAHAVDAVADECAKGKLFPWEVANEASRLLGVLTMLHGDDPELPAGQVCDARDVIGMPSMVRRRAADTVYLAKAWLASQGATCPSWPEHVITSHMLLRDEPEDAQRIRRLVASDVATLEWYHERERPDRGCNGMVEITARITVDKSALQVCGDAGGPQDSRIAQAARRLTKETDPGKVIWRLAEMRDKAVVCEAVNGHPPDAFSSTTILIPIGADALPLSALANR